ncbi:hypothetical protein Tco_0593264 [Tanacetum coccineum]
MTTLQFADTHNLVTFLAKPTESEGFEQVVDFLNAHTIKYALTVNPIIYTSCIEQFWATVMVKTVNKEQQLQALVDGKKIVVTEASVRRNLQLDDEEGINCLPNATIFEELTRMGYEKLSQKLTFYKAFFSPQWKFLIHTILQCLSAKTTAWNEFSSTMASAIICLATNQKFNFSKYIFESMVKNLDNAGKFLMYPRQGKDFSGRETPLFPTMVVQAQEEIGEGSAMPTDPHHTPIITQPSSSQPQRKHKSREALRSKDHQFSLYEASLGNQEDASKQGRKIHDIDADEDITLENVHDAELFDVNDLHGDELFVEKEVHFKEVYESITTTTTIPSKDKGKGIMVEEPLQMKKKDQISFDEQEAIRLQAEFDEEVRLAREKDEANVALIEEWNDIQAKIETDYELAQRLQAEEQEELTIDENGNMAGWKPKDLKSKSFANIQELFDKAFKRVNTFVDFRTELVEGTKMEESSKKAEVMEESSKKAEIAQESSSKRAGDELEQENAKKQKVDDDQEAAKMKELMKIVPDEEEVAVDAIPLATKPPSIIDWKIVKEGKISYY